MPLPDDSLDKWVYKEHTNVKHEILSKYLDAWTRILGKFHDLNVFDCFAGRGRYPGGEEGSPLIIIDALARVRKNMNRPDEAMCLFIEKNKNNYENLVDELKKSSIDKLYGNWLHVNCVNEEFSDVASDVIKQFNHNLAPSFFFVDPFGFGGIPFEIIKGILAIPKTEVFISFMIRDVNRFLDSSRHKRSIEELYGIENVKSELARGYSSLPNDQALLKLYRDRLHNDAKVEFTQPFKINADEKLQTTYYLIHCTHNPKGCEIMKQIMYKAGTEGRFAYLGPAEGQMTLHQFDNNRLKDLLLKKFAGRSISYENLRYDTLMDVEAIKANYKTAILELEKDEKILIRGKGPRGGLLETTIIKFL